MFQPEGKQIKRSLRRVLDAIKAVCRGGSAGQRLALWDGSFKEPDEKQSVEARRNLYVTGNTAPGLRVGADPCIAIVRHTLDRTAGKIAKCRRGDAHQISKAARECAHAVVANVKADINYLALGLQQQTLGFVQPQRVEKLRGRHTGDLAEGAIEMIPTRKRNLSHGSQRERLVNLVAHGGDYPLNRFVM